MAAAANAVSASVRTGVNLFMSLIFLRDRVGLGDGIRLAVECASNTAAAVVNGCEARYREKRDGQGGSLDRQGPGVRFGGKRPLRSGVGLLMRLRVPTVPLVERGAGGVRRACHVGRGKDRRARGLGRQEARE